MSREKVFIVYDSKGNIKATGVPQSAKMRIAGAPGRAVLEIDHPGLERGEITSYLQDLHRNYRIDTQAEPRLVRKQ